MKNFITLIALLVSQQILAQKIEVPKSYSNLEYNKNGELVFNLDGEKFVETYDNTKTVLKNLQGHTVGSEKGIEFDFKGAVGSGIIYYGFIPYHDMKYPLPVYFKRTAKIKDGKAEINITKMKGKYDMISWEENKYGTLGYRIQDSKGNLRFEGVVSFEGNGPFKIADGIIEGPSIAITKPYEVVLRLKTNKETLVVINIAGEQIESNGLIHEIVIKDLEPDTEYDYRVTVGKQAQNYSLKTSPKPGSRKEFSFAYASISTW